MLEVEGGAAFAGVDGEEAMPHVARHRRHRPGIVADARFLDLEHVGAQVREDPRGVAAGQQSGEVEHADAGEREGGRGGHRVPRRERP
jgi:hypothetical protein